MSRPRVVLDTMVVISALLGNENSAARAVLKSVETGEVELLVSDAWLRELVAVLTYPRVATLLQMLPNSPARAFQIALSLGLMGTFVRPRRLDWPSLSDPKDAWIFDLAYSGKADYIISRDIQVIKAARALEMNLLDPRDLLERLRLEHLRASEE